MNENYLIFQNKKAKIFLKNGHCYTGYVKSVSSDSLLIKDKFNLDVVINVSDISLVREAVADGN